jgi:hypothetical protein
MFHELNQLSGMKPETIRHIFRLRAIEHLLADNQLPSNITSYCCYDELTAAAFPQRLRSLRCAGYGFVHAFNEGTGEMYVLAKPETVHTTWASWLPTPVRFANYFAKTLPQIQQLGTVPTLGYDAGDAHLGGSGKRSEEWIGAVRVCRSMYTFDQVEAKQLTVYCVRFILE